MGRMRGNSRILFPFVLLPTHRIRLLDLLLCSTDSCSLARFRRISSGELKSVPLVVSHLIFFCCFRAFLLSPTPTNANSQCPRPTFNSIKSSSTSPLTIYLPFRLLNSLSFISTSIQQNFIGLMRNYCSCREGQSGWKTRGRGYG